MKMASMLFIMATVFSSGAHAFDLNGMGGDLLKNLQKGSDQNNQNRKPAADLSGLSNADVVKGLKQALDQGTVAAVGKLGKENGFFGNPQVKIPLPSSLQSVESALRLAGQGKAMDDLVLTMNRAAEAAVPQAKPIILNAIKNMSVQDAKGILTGGDDAATRYFRGATEGQLREKFLPIVSNAVNKLGVTEKYNSLAGRAAQFGLLDEKQASVQGYVTQKALDGLFLMIGQEEQAIRKDPVQRTGYWVKKVFGAANP